MRKINMQELVPEEVCNHHILLSSLLVDKQFIIYFQEDLRKLLASPFEDRNSFPFKALTHNNDNYILTELTNWLVLIQHGNPIFSCVPWGEVTIVDEWFGTEILPELSEFIINQAHLLAKKSFLSILGGYGRTKDIFGDKSISECELELLSLGVGLSLSKLDELIHQPNGEKQIKERLKLNEAKYERDTKIFKGLIDKISTLRIQCS